jgi:hypothetical protein
LEKYKHSEGRADYRSFCKYIDTGSISLILVFTKNELEKYPLEEVNPPTKEWLTEVKDALI